MSESYCLAKRRCFRMQRHSLIEGDVPTDHRLGPVGANRAWNPSERGERVDVVFQERLQPSRRESLSALPDRPP